MLMYIKIGHGHFFIYTFQVIIYSHPTDSCYITNTAGKVSLKKPKEKIV
jgi:hypothetical protein